MVIKCRVDKNDEKTFDLVEFDAGYFSADCKLKLITTDLGKVKQVFGKFDNVEIYKQDNLIGEYNSFDGFSALSYIGSVWSEGSKSFVECMEITLTKVNIAEQVKRIDEQLNPVIDVDKMNIDELKEYKISKINAAGSSDIYSGGEVELSDGTVKHFRYAQTDQANLESYLALILASDDRENLFVPYHETNGICRNFGYIDIVLIYFTLSMKKLQVFTYVNMLRDWVRSMEDIDQVKEIEYGVELPTEYQEKMNEIVQGSLTSLMAIKEKFIPSTQSQSTTETEPEQKPISDNNTEESGEVI